MPHLLSRPLRRGLGLALGAAVLAAPAMGASPVDLQPEELPRGADIAVPHVEGGVFVDGDRRVDLGTTYARLLGRSGSAWILGASDADGGRDDRIVRLRPDGSLRVLVRGVNPWTLTLSDDGGRLARSAARPRSRTSVAKVWSARTGRVLAERTFEGYVGVVALAGDEVVLSSDAGTMLWDSSTDWTGPVTRRRAAVVDLELDLMASYTGDPYLDGCMVVSRFTRPGRVLWRSCRERVEAFSPDGALMATVHILADGLGPGDVWLRELRGTRRARYSTGWFGAIAWESEEALLLEVNGDEKSATVRCVVDACENATDPVPVPRYRAAG